MIQALVESQTDQHENVRSKAAEALEKLDKAELIAPTLFADNLDISPGLRINMMSFFKQARDKRSSSSSMPMHQYLREEEVLPLLSEEELTKVAWKEKKSSIAEIAIKYKDDFINEHQRNYITLSLPYTKEPEAWNSPFIIKSILEELKVYFEATITNLLQEIKIDDASKAGQLQLIMNCKYDSYVNFIGKLLQEAGFNFPFIEEERSDDGDNLHILPERVSRRVCHHTRPSLEPHRAQFRQWAQDKTFRCTRDFKIAHDRF